MKLTEEEAAVLRKIAGIQTSGKAHFEGDEVAIVERLLGDTERGFLAVTITEAGRTALQDHSHER